MMSLLRGLRDLFVSLRFTVVLLALGILLVFAATLDQVNLGIWAVQQKYFRSFFVLWRAGDVPIPVFPGGYLIGGLLLLNLAAAQLTRLKLTVKKSGIWLTHLGLILLLLGELLSGLWQEDYQMRLEEGQGKNYSESYRDNEVAIIDATDPQWDDVVVIPESIIAKGESLQIGKLPFRVVPKLYYPNSELLTRTEGPSAPPPAATAGFGPQIIVQPVAMTYKQDERNLPSAVLDLVSPEGSLGTFIVSSSIRAATGESVPQKFSYGGHNYKILLRPKRDYRPYTVTLQKFSHDVYQGTDIPKNFSSRVRLTTPDKSVDREALIYMNNPLRYDGLTFYQASFEKGNDHLTILQVVRNPSWQLPYWACGMMALGLVIQFGLSLSTFVTKRRNAA